MTWIPLAHYGEQDWEGATGDRVAAVPDTMRELLLADAQFARRIRLMGIALAALRDRIDRGAWPMAGPTELSDPALCDPLVGAPFRWSLDGARAILGADATTGDRVAPAETVTLAVAASPSPPVGAPQRSFARSEVLEGCQLGRTAHAVPGVDGACPATASLFVWMGNPTTRSRSWSSSHPPPPASSPPMPASRVTVAPQYPAACKAATSSEQVALSAAVTISLQAAWSAAGSDAQHAPRPEHPPPPMPESSVLTPSQYPAACKAATSAEQVAVLAAMTSFRAR